MNTIDQKYIITSTQIERICDNLCRLPRELNQKDLEVECDECPFQHLEKVENIPQYIKARKILLGNS